MTEPDSPLDLEAISERYFAAWAARDPDAIADLHTEDTTFWSHLGTDPVRGRNRVRDNFAELFELFPELGFDTHRVLYGAGFWVLDWDLTFLTPGSDERSGFHCLDVVDVASDGLVSRKETFVDMVQLQAVLPGRDVGAEAAEVGAGVGRGVSA
ncbi:MAG: nuclear transport factor 2 family protein [Solirubrobacterales bacterium]